jgi:glucosamine-6-phosphate deaminase
MRVESYASRDAMAAASAAAIAAAIRQLLARQSAVRMIFAAAPSPAEMLTALAAAGDIDWQRVTAFHMDEYVGLPARAPERFASWLDRHLFDKVPFGAVHRIVPEPDPATTAARYTAALAEAPIDIVCLGIGVNGHIAFNDPPVADFNDPLDVKLVDLDEVCRQQQVDDEGFTRLADVPLQAVTLTVPRLLRAERLYCVVPGAAKRQAVRLALEGPIAESCPASILRTHQACTLYLDRESDPHA